MSVLDVYGIFFVQASSLLFVLSLSLSLSLSLLYYWIAWTCVDSLSIN